MRGAGLQLEQNAPWIKTYDSDVLMQMAQPESERYASFARMWSATKIIDNSADSLKQKILQNGAATFSYYDDYNDFVHQSISGTGYSEDRTSYYQATKTNSNKTVTVVGWDDDYSRDNFNTDQRPNANGAWLVKASWGDQWADGGYYWISYEDPSIDQMVSFVSAPADVYDHIYQYDGAYPKSFFKIPTIGKMANVFTAQRNELLTHVAFFSHNELPVQVTAEVYVAPEGFLYTGTNPVSGFEKVDASTTTVNNIEYGYSTIELETPACLSEGRVFSVVLTMSPGDPMQNDQIIMIPVEGKTADNPAEGVSSYAGSVGDSFVGYNDSWFDTNDYAGMDYNNVPLKAMTRDITLTEPTLTLENVPNKTVYCVGETLDTTGLSLRYTDEFGIAQIVTEGYFCEPTQFSAPGTQTVSVTYNTLSVTFDVTVANYRDGVFTFADEAKTILLSCDPDVQGVVTVPDGVTVIREAAFAKCYGITDVILPQYLKEIDDYAFAYDFHIRSITLPEELETIGDGAFFATGLSQISIPASVRSIGYGAFIGVTVDYENSEEVCTLQSITVNADNPYYTADDGVLYTKDLTELVQYPSAKPAASFVIPDGVTSVRKFAFCAAWDLEKLFFPASLTEIGEGLALYGVDAPHDRHPAAYLTKDAAWFDESDVEESVEIAQMTDIAIRSLPEKTTYTLGETFDPTGLEVDAVYDNGETLSLPYVVDVIGASLDTVGKQTVVVSYGRCSTTFDVTVLPTSDMPSVTVRDAVVGYSARRLVHVAVELNNNPGIIATRLHIGYDTQQLKLVKVENGTVFRDDTFQPGGTLTNEPYTVLWSDDIARTDNTADGTLVTMTFEVQPTATVGDTAVTVTCDDLSTFNAALQPVALYTIDGTVSIVDCMPGDANEDGAISLMDSVMISRYLAGGWDVTINTINADVNGDDVLDLKDVILIRRFLAGGWNVQLI